MPTMKGEVSGYIFQNKIHPIWSVNVKFPNVAGVVWYLYLKLVLY